MKPAKNNLKNKKNKKQKPRKRKNPNLTQIRGTVLHRVCIGHEGYVLKYIKYVEDSWVRDYLIN